MYGSFGFPASVFGEFERLSRAFDGAFAASRRHSLAPGSFPALNVGSTPDSVEVALFAPGVDASKIEITLDRGVLTLSGERELTQPDGDAKQRVSNRERRAGSFTRAVALPDDIDPARVDASYSDGVLRVSIARKEATQPRRITVQ